MEKERTFKLIAFIALFVAVVGSSIGFAAFSSTLEIKGSANFKTQSWNVHFENLEKSSNMTAIEFNAPLIESNTTVISGLKAEFNKPGQVAEYTFDIVNGGTFDSIITGVTINTPNCIGTGTNATTDAENVCKNLSVKLTDSTGADITTGRELKASGDSETGRLENCKLTITYNALTPANELPTNDVEVSDIDVSIVFGQN